MTIASTLRFILDTHHIFSYLVILLIWMMCALNGIILFSLTFSTKNKLLLLGGGMIIGIAALVLWLSVFSYLIKGPFAILFLFISYCFVSFILYLKFSRNDLIRDLFRFKLNFLNIVNIALLFFYAGVLFIFNIGASYAGDVNTYWSLATSYARGNYPTVSPWQPHFLSAYHQGTIMVMGAIYSLSDINIHIVHYFFSIYLALALLFLLTGFAREKNRSIFCLLPGVFALINFGGPLFLLKLTKISSNELAQFVDVISQKGTTGSCGTWLGDFTFCNFRMFGFALLLLFLVLIVYWFKQFTFWKFFFLTILTFILLSVDESLVIVPITTLFVLYIIHFRSKFFSREFVKSSAILILTGIALFFIVQNPFRDELFTSSTRSRFDFFNNHLHELSERTNFISSLVTSPKLYKNTEWFLPDLRIMAIILLIFGLLLRSRSIIALSVSAVVMLLGGLFFYDYYWEQNGRRMFLTGYQLIMIAISFMLLEVRVRPRRSYIILFYVLLFMLLPQTIYSHLRIFKEIKNSTNNNLTYNFGYADPVLDVIARLIKHDQSILLLDGYPTQIRYSQLTSSALIEYGLFVPSGPAGIKVVNVDTGPEWYDAMLTLSPTALNKIKPDYIYIAHSARTQFSPYRLAQIKSYFQPVYYLNEGIIYNVSDGYYQTETDRQTLEDMINLIPNGATVYVDSFDNSEIRKGVIVNLSSRAKIMGPQYNFGGDFYMYIEYKPIFLVVPPTQIITRIPGLEYVFARPEKELDARAFEKIDSIYGVTLWKRKYN